MILHTRNFAAASTRAHLFRIKGANESKAGTLQITKYRSKKFMFTLNLVAVCITAVAQIACLHSDWLKGIWAYTPVAHPPRGILDATLSISGATPNGVLPFRIHINVIQCP